MAVAVTKPNLTKKQLAKLIPECELSKEECGKLLAHYDRRRTEVQAAAARCKPHLRDIFDLTIISDSRIEKSYISESVFAANDTTVDEPAEEPDTLMYWRRGVFQKRAVSVIDETTWIAENLFIKDVRPSEAPSKFAWGVLNQLRKDSRFRDRWLEQISLRRMPSQALMDEESERRMRDSGREALEIIAAVRRRTITAQALDDDE